MSAVGGGRSFQVLIDLILRGVPQAQQGINSVVTGLTGLQRGATGAQGPVHALDRSITGVGANSRTAASGTTTLSTATGGMARSFQGAGNGATILTNTLSNVSVQTRAATSGIGPLTSGLGQLGSISTTTESGVSRLGAAKVALRENIRSMIFPIGGMIGALNEAMFMTGRSADMDAKLSEAKAELARLTKIGAEGTSEYAQAQAEVDRATRALNFTNRIATQSWFDVVFFMGSLLGAATGVIGRYKELASGATALGGKMSALGGIGGKLTSVFNAVTGGLTGLDGAFTRSGKSSKILANGLPPVAKGVNTVGQGAKGAIPAMAGMGGAAVSLAAALKGVAVAALAIVAPIAAVVAGVSAWAAITVAQEKNVGGLGDAMDNMTNSISGLLNQTIPGLEEWYDNLVLLTDMQRTQTVAWLEQIPVIGEWIKSLDASTESSNTAATGMIGIADSAKVVSVALDGSLVPTTDLAKANLDLGATAGQLLEKNGLLGAGMKILGTDMTLAGDQAIYLAAAYLQTEQASVKATQEAYNAVVGYQGFEKTVTMTTAEVIAYAAELEAAGLITGETAKEAEVATNSFAAMKAEWAASRAELQPLVHEMDGFLISFSHAPNVVAGLTQGLESFNESVHGGRVELVAQATEIALLQGGWTELNRVILLGEEGMVQYAEQNQHVLEGTEEVTTSTQELTQSVKEEAQALAELHPNLAGAAEILKQTTGEQKAWSIEAQNAVDVSTELGEAYFELSDAERDRLQTLGITRQMMGEAAAGTRILSAEQVTLVDSSVKAAEAQTELTEAMTDFAPSIQEHIQSWGIYQEALTGSEQAMAQVAVAGEHLQGMYDDAVGTAREFAISQVGVTEALQMTDAEVMNFLLTADDLVEAQKTVAETAQEEAERFAEFWTENLDKVVESMDAWGETMKSAFKTVGEEAGEEMEITGTEIKEKFAKGVAFTDQFWETVFPVGLADEALEKSFNLDDVIQDTRAFLEDAMDKGLVTEADVQKGFEPFLQFLEGLPADVKNSWGAINAAMPDIMGHFRETVVGGVKFGPEIKSALHEGIVKPVIETLQKGGGFETAGPKMIEVAKKMLAMPGLDQTTKAMLKMALYDPLNNMAARDLPDAVGRVLAVLDTIAPGTRAMVEGIDTNLSGVADIFDTNMLTPMEQMRLEALNLGLVIAEAFGNTTAVNKFSAEIAALTDKATLSHGEVLALSDSVNAVGTAAGGSSSAMGGLATTFSSLGTNAADVAGIIKEINDEIAQGDDPAEDLSEAELKIAEALGLIDENGNAVPGKIDAITNAINGGIDPTKTAWEQADTLQEKLALINGTAPPAATNIATVGAAAGTAGTGIGGMGTAAVGVITPLGTANTAAANLNTTLSETTAMSIAWMAHFQSIQATLNSIFVPTMNSMSGILLKQYNDTVTHTTNMSVAWLAHFQAIQTAATTHLEPTLARYYTLLTEMSTNVWAHTNLASQHWNHHALAVANAYTSIMLSIQGTIADLLSFSTNTWTHTNLASQHWNHHALAVANVKNSIMLSIQGTIADLTSFSTNTHAHTNVASQHWDHHAQVVAAVKNSIKSSIDGLVQDLRHMATQTHSFTNNASQHWEHHEGVVKSTTNSMAQTISSMARSAASSVNALANSVSNAMGRIVTDMDKASAAARRLQASINALRSKSITVTTNYRTTGTKPSGARGFNGVVNRPTDIHAGEGGRPEFVNIVPLQGTAGAHHNGLAALGKSGMRTSPTTVRAATGTGTGVIVGGGGGGGPNLRMASDDLTAYRRHVERELAAAARAWDNYAKAVGSVDAAMRGGGAAGGGGGGRAPITPRYPDTRGPHRTPGNLPNPHKPVKDWLHEDVVDSWAHSFGYDLKKYDPLTASKLKFRLSPERKDFKYIWEDIAAGWLQKHKWRFSQGGYEPTGDHKTTKHSLDMTVQKAQHGLNAKVRKPTMILAGEHGMEDVSITPGSGRRRGGGRGGGIIDNHIIIDGIEMKRWLRKVSNEGYSAMR